MIQFALLPGVFRAIFFYVYGYFTYMCTWYLWRPGEGIGSPGAGVADCWELTFGCWQLNLGSLRIVSVLKH